MDRSFVTAALHVAGGIATAATGFPAPSFAGAPLPLRETNPEDCLYFATDLVHEGRNGNGDVFSREEMERAWRGLVGMPIDLDHDMKVAAIVGQIYDAKYLIEAGRAVIRVAGFIHRRFFPVVAWLVATGIVQGVSMECLFAASSQNHTGRVLHGVQFVGMAVCRIPADNDAWIDRLQESEVTASHHLLLLAAAAYAAA